MKSHRVIWTIAGFVVLVAALSVIVRDARAPAANGTLQPMTNVVSHFDEAQSQILIDAMKACLEKDPQARRPNTRMLVEGVAHLAASGMLESADTFYALGVMRSGERDFQGAEAAFRKAVTLRADWKWGFNQLGIVLHSMGRPEESEEMFRKAIAIDPNWGRAHNDLAILLRLMGRMDEAEAEAKKSLELDPESVAGHNNYGNLLVALSRFEEAKAAYKKATAIEPDHPAPYYNLACLASRQGHHHEVVPLLLCAIEFDPAYRDEARHDSDFDAVRNDAAFKLLVGAE
ncbi:MAG: tetratricopeptide repeat protein [Candidatus Hydrogenedentes bacterium]|nr:tetratricopeptide repeat protein [Candidatus Hydrogenedentota bacterium]